MRETSWKVKSGILSSETSPELRQREYNQDMERTCR